MTAVRPWPPPPDAATARPESSEARTERLIGRLRIVVGAVIVAVAALAVVESWDDVRGALALMEPLDLVGSELLVLLGLGLSVLTWRRSLGEVGSALGLPTASRVYLLGQLGKYLPGSVWALLAQAELGRAVGVPRARGLAASLIAVAVNACTGLAMGVVLIPRVSDRPWAVWSIVILATLCAVALAPPVLTRLVDAGLRVVNRPQLERPVTWRGIATAGSWSVASAICYGLSVWILAVAVGAPAGETLALCIAGVPLAMNVGLFVFVTPSGLGVREAVIVAALSPVLEPSEGLAVALVARFVFTAADLLAAATVFPLRPRPAEAT
jgi:glycosyltransferase 2 family protein